MMPGQIKAGINLYKISLCLLTRSRQTAFVARGNPRAQTVRLERPSAGHKAQRYTRS